MNALMVAPVIVQIEISKLPSVQIGEIFGSMYLIHERELIDVNE